MRGRRLGLAGWAAFGTWLQVASAQADLEVRPSVTGTEVTDVQVASTQAASATAPPVPWTSLATTNVVPGTRWLTFTVAGTATAVSIPVCAGRKHVVVDGQTTLPDDPAPFVIDLPAGPPHRVAIEVAVSSYEHRVACGEAPRWGTRGSGHEGLSVLPFPSARTGANAGRAVVYLPKGHDATRPAALLVGLHPWNGSIWTYAAYAALLHAADASDVVLLFPSGLGNSLYTASAEEEVLAAIAALPAAVAVDPDRITLWGASMGGAGATTIGFHHPDLFAGIVSLFGDSRYDLATYVRGILHDDAGAHRVNALDIVTNARNVPVWLIHGEEDRVSPLAQSAMLARALSAQHLPVTFDAVPGVGHEGVVVTTFAARIVDRAAHALRNATPRRVSFSSVRPTDTEAYGIRLTREVPTGDAFFDLVRVGDIPHLREARGVRAILVPRGAFGFAPTETPAFVHDDPGSRGVAIHWDAP